MPVNKDDLAAARHIVELGYPTLDPVMRDMVRSMRVAESPVADAFAEFFSDLGAPAVPVIRAGLLQENCWLGHRIFTRVLPRWPAEAILELRSALTTIATRPDAYNNDLRSIAVLARHQLTTAQWLIDWLEFKKQGMLTRSTLLSQVEAEVKGASASEKVRDVPGPADGQD